MKIQLLIKRIVDFTLALIALIILLPLMLILSIIIYLELGWPLFFVHERPGKNGKASKMIKFRSDKRDSNGGLLKDEERLNSFGKFLRSLSLDELPELFNVIKGDMSLVGPRPLLKDYLPFYNMNQSKRHTMKPGRAQVNGRNAISWDEKFGFDIWYVENWSLLLDIKIMIITVWKVFKREGINQRVDLNMEMWTGNANQ